LFKKVFKKRVKDVNATLKDIQNGNISARNNFIESHEPYILKEISKISHRYTTKEDDEFSIGLFAFNEAIDKFDFSKGNSFYSLASVVIRNRVIDFLRKENKHKYHLSFDEKDEESEHAENISESKVSIDRFQQEEKAKRLKEEISDFVKHLDDFGISLEELVEISPKHKDARENIFSIVQSICKDEDMINYILKHKRIPLKELLHVVDCSRKTLERNRKYILAIFVIYNGNYTFLKGYLKGVGI
jgi:RNA polymerase sigma factor